MTHELKKIIAGCIFNEKKGLKSVLATVVDLDGSSYRRPGVRMLIGEDGSMTGAVSGGCVEKEVLLQAHSVFKNNKAKVMTYDGRYRLGCEGVLYILLEPFEIGVNLQQQFSQNFRDRKSLKIVSYYRKQEFQSFEMGSLIEIEDGKKIAFSKFQHRNEEADFAVFCQEMPPLFKLLIIGSEHDAVQLCLAASLLGWEVNIVASPKDPRTTANFPGAAEVLHLTPEEAGNLNIDKETAVVLMNHNYATDLKFLLSIKDKDPVYIGLLGSVKRREKLLHELMEYFPQFDETLLEKIHGPAGLNIGAETPQEIAISILSEILTVVREKEAVPLRQKSGKIHN